MITDYIKQWEANKHKLAEYFRTTPQDEYRDYEVIVRRVFELCIPEANEYDGWDLDKMTLIDDGDYQGTQIFIIPDSSYQPGVYSYIMTHTYYGSCSGCDTLQGIRGYGANGLPSESQVLEYMTLALHLVQRIKKLDEL